jgi:hypothetical protein
MAVGQDNDHAPPRSRDRAVFELERFGWSSADRLEVRGRFVGLDEPLGSDVAIVLQGGDGPSRVPVVAEESTFDQRGWRAAFDWDEAAPFEAATLLISADLFVELPEPRARRRPFGRVVLDVQRIDAGDDQFPSDEAEPAEPAERVRWQAGRLAAQQEARELRAEAQRIAEELKRARTDLEAERSERSADAERFREGLAQVQAAAEDALATKDAQLAETRAELEVARAELVELQSAVQLVEEENAGRRAALDEAREEGERLRRALEQARSGEAGMRAAAEAARTEAAELRNRLVAARDALGDLP